MITLEQEKFTVGPPLSIAGMLAKIVWINAVIQDEEELPIPFCVLLVSLNCTNFVCVCDANEEVCLSPTAPTPMRPPPWYFSSLSVQASPSVLFSLSKIVTQTVLISLRVALSPVVAVPFIPSHSPNAFLCLPVFRVCLPCAPTIVREDPEDGSVASAPKRQNE